MNTNLTQAIFIAGILQFGILSAGLVMTKTLKWKTELKKINPLSEHIIWTHGAYVWFTILAFALLSVLYPTTLITDKPLGKSICLFIALFWGIRLAIQLFYFDAKPYLTNKMLRLGYHSLTFCFFYFTIVYGLAYFTYETNLS